MYTKAVVLATWLYIRIILQNFYVTVSFKASQLNQKYKVPLKYAIIQPPVDGSNSAGKSSPMNVYNSKPWILCSRVIIF